MIKVTEERFCDRCNKKIAWGGPIRIKRKLFIDVNSVYENNLTMKRMRYNIDLCKECYQSFEEWMETAQNAD